MTEPAHPRASSAIRPPRRRPRRHHRVWASFLPLAALLLAVGVGVGLQFAPQPAVTALSRPAGQLALAPRSQQFSDPRQLAVSLRAGAAQAIVTRTDGTLTSLACDPARPIASGERVYAVDGVDTVALHTSVPLWRSLRYGDRGADVTALQRALQRLEPHLAVSGRYDGATAAAVGRLFTSSGSTWTGSTLPLARLAWLPGQRVYPSTCPVAVGQLVTAGQTLVGLPAPVVGAAVRVDPAAVPGRRELLVGGARFPLPPDGQLTSTALLAALANLAPSATPGAGLRVDSELASPITAETVPASAIVGAGDASCVIDPAGRAVPIRVVSSTLGTSLITGADPHTKVLAFPPSDRRCG